MSMGKGSIIPIVLIAAVIIAITYAAIIQLGSGKLEKRDFQSEVITPSYGCDATNQQRDSNGWVIYRNNTDKFLIKYPSSWLTAKPISCWISILNTQPLYKKGQREPSYFEGYKTINMFRVHLTSQNPQQFFSDLGTPNGVNSDLYDSKSIESIEFKGLPTKRIKRTTSGKGWSSESIAILNGNNIYEITIIPYGGSKDEEIKSILDTIEFLD